jgi:hypothetical protein
MEEKQTTEDKRRAFHRSNTLNDMPKKKVQIKEPIDKAHKLVRSEKPTKREKAKSVKKKRKSLLPRSKKEKRAIFDHIAGGNFAAIDNLLNRDETYLNAKMNGLSPSDYANYCNLIRASKALVSIESWRQANIKVLDEEWKAVWDESVNAYSELLRDKKYMYGLN